MTRNPERNIQWVQFEEYACFASLAPFPKVSELYRTLRFLLDSDLHLYIVNSCVNFQICLSDLFVSFAASFSTPLLPKIFSFTLPFLLGVWIRLQNSEWSPGDPIDFILRGSFPSYLLQSEFWFLLMLSWEKTASFKSRESVFSVKEAADSGLLLSGNQFTPWEGAFPVVQKEKKKKKKIKIWDLIKLVN